MVSCLVRCVQAAVEDGLRRIKDGRSMTGTVMGSCAQLFMPCLFRDREMGTQLRLLSPEQMHREVGGLAEHNLQLAFNGYVERD